MKKITLIFLGLFFSFSFAQVGIGTASPTEMLDVNGNIRSRTIYTSPGANTDYPVVVTSTGVLKSNPKNYGGFEALAGGTNTTLSTVLGADAKTTYAVDGNTNAVVTLPKAVGVAGKEISFYIWGGSMGTTFTFVGNSIADGNINLPSAVWLTVAAPVGRYIPNTDFRFTTLASINRVSIISNPDKYRFKKITFISDGTNWWLSIL